MLNDLHKKYAAKGLVVIGLHSDPETDNGIKAAKEEKMLYPVAFDGGKLMDTLGCDAYPTFVLVDKKGLLRKIDIDPSEMETTIASMLAEK